MDLITVFLDLTAVVLIISSSSRNWIQLRKKLCCPDFDTGTKKNDHITPVLANLRRLPVKFSIDFKILLITLKN